MFICLGEASRQRRVGGCKASLWCRARVQGLQRCFGNQLRGQKLSGATYFVNRYSGPNAISSSAEQARRQTHGSLALHPSSLDRVMGPETLRLAWTQTWGSVMSSLGLGSPSRALHGCYFYMVRIIRRTTIPATVRATVSGSSKPYRLKERWEYIIIHAASTDQAI